MLQQDHLSPAATQGLTNGGGPPHPSVLNAYQVALKPASRAGSRTSSRASSRANSRASSRHRGVDWLVERDSEEPHRNPVMDDDLSCDDQDSYYSVLDRLNTFRRGSEFCDVDLEVGGHDISAHRVVLASASGFLYELFSRDMSQQHFKLENLDYDTFIMLVDYAYTYRLRVPADSVRAVYKMANFLKMPKAAEACSAFLASNLKPSNCLGVRSFANSSSDEELTNLTDEYIQQNIDVVMDSPETKTLPFLQLNIIGVENTDLEEDTAQSNLCKMVVDWVEMSMIKYSFDDVINQPHVLYLTSDNNLKDCSEIGDDMLESDDMVQDYRRLCKKRAGRNVDNLVEEEVTSSGKVRSHNGDKAQKSPPIVNPPSPFAHMPLYKRLSNDRLSTMSAIDHEFKVIAVKMVAERCCMCLAMLDDTLTRLSLTLRPKPSQASNGQSTPSNGLSNGDVLVTPADSPHGSVCGDKQCGLTPLGAMESARCSMGLAVISDQLVAVGGYDRGDCLSACEAFDLNTNSWSPMPSMLSNRGRLDVAQTGEYLYACGGSDGFTDLSSAEYLDTREMKWKKLPDMKTSRSSGGVAAVDGIVYVLGGWKGQTGIPYCEMLESNHEKWTSIAKMHVGRSQAAVCAVNGKLVVAGGSDSWNCLNSVEIYCPNENVWRRLPDMAIARRGAGIAVFKDKIFVVGGSDGTSALSSVEIYDFETQTWSFGPQLSIARANTGAIVYRGRLFTVGGFSGKDFLNTMEYLTEDGQEWCSFLPIDI